jgi:very-short-patch-repair endonuclease
MQRKRPLQARNDLETRLWVCLRALEGYRFRKQSPFKTFTLDFAEHTVRLAISLEDGEPGTRSIHIVRDRLLSEQGYVILRLWRAEVAADIGNAIHRIRGVLEDLSGPDSR